MNLEEVPSDTLTQCDWVTKSGALCRNFALPGSNYCLVHQPQNKNTSTSKYIRDDKLFDLLIQEIKALLQRFEILSTKNNSSFIIPDKLLSNLKNYVKGTSPQNSREIFDRLRRGIEEDVFDLDTWRGAWYMLNYTYEYQSDLLKRRFRGEYETDEWGLDWEFLNIMLPFFEFLYSKYWRVELTGVDHVPTEGRAILVANHSGQVPWDTLMLLTAIKLENPSGRLIRTLYDPSFTTIPFYSDLFNKFGQALATKENATQLMIQEELIAVFPEGYQGIGKLYKDRYQLEPFRHTEFIRASLQTKSQIIPVSIVGAEEAYISLANSKTLAKIMGTPYFPLTPTWPLFGLLGTIPLPSKWFIDFHEPININDFGAESATDIALIHRLAEYFRETIQQMVNNRLKSRESILFG